jgi:hypothetical protein
MDTVHIKNWLVGSLLSPNHRRENDIKLNISEVKLEFEE